MSGYGSPWTTEGAVGPFRRGTDHPAKVGSAAEEPAIVGLAVKDRAELRGRR